MRKAEKRIILMIIAIILFIGFYNSIHPRFEVVNTETYIVSCGDTLWEIAERYADDSIDIREYIRLIYEYNENLFADIEVGQTITIPILNSGGTKKLNSKD